VGGGGVGIGCIFDPNLVLAIFFFLKFLEVLKKIALAI
jgi:hypothetical protein